MPNTTFFPKSHNCKNPHKITCPQNDLKIFIIPSQMIPNHTTLPKISKYPKISWPPSKLNNIICIIKVVLLHVEHTTPNQTSFVYMFFLTILDTLPIYHPFTHVTKILPHCQNSAKSPINHSRSPTNTTSYIS